MPPSEVILLGSYRFAQLPARLIFGQGIQAGSGSSRSELEESDPFQSVCTLGFRMEMAMVLITCSGDWIGEDIHVRPADLSAALDTIDHCVLGWTWLDFIDHG